MPLISFGVIAVILLVVGCLGGLTVGLGAIENTLSLVAVVIPTMITLSFLIAAAPMKWIINSAPDFRTGTPNLKFE